MAFCTKYKINPSSNSAILGIGRTIFAVMLAMVTVDILGKFVQAQQNSLQEANTVGNIFRFSQYLPQKDASAIYSSTQNYLNYVVKVEIPAQDQTQLSIDKVKVVGYDYINNILTVTLNSQGQSLIKSHLLDLVDKLYLQRRTRISQTNAHLSSFLWSVLFLGWLLLLINTMLVKSQPDEDSLLMNLISNIGIAIIFILMILYNYPFTGPIKVDTSPYQQVIDNMKVFWEDKNQNSLLNGIQNAP